MQWNDASLDCVTTMSTTSNRGFAAIQAVTVSPSWSRCWNIVAENTFTPLKRRPFTLSTVARACGRPGSPYWLLHPASHEGFVVPGGQTTAIWSMALSSTKVNSVVLVACPASFVSTGTSASRSVKRSVLFMMSM